MATPNRSRTRVRTTDTTLGGGDAAAGTAVEAYVVEPAAGHPRAGVLFLHWLGDHRSDRTQFLTEARALAPHGVRSILPAGRLPWVPDPVDAETDIANIELEQRRLSAALDALVDGLPEGAPVALVGHDFGAMHGLLLAARRPVLKAAVVIAATPRWADWFLRFWKVDGDRFDYLRRLAPLDPIESARSLTAPTLWQFSERDFFIAPMSALKLAKAAPGEPTIEWYKADHAMRSAKPHASRASLRAPRAGPRLSRPSTQIAGRRWNAGRSVRRSGCTARRGWAAFAVTWIARRSNPRASPWFAVSVDPSFDTPIAGRFSARAGPVVPVRTLARMSWGAEGSRWAPSSSKRVARRSASRGGFDSHALPPCPCVTSPTYDAGHAPAEHR